MHEAVLTPILCIALLCQLLLYQPKKPIKHGVKVFALCCAETGFILSFEVFVGNEGDPDKSNSPKDVVTRLLAGIDMETNANRVLYTDNWYVAVGSLWVK